MYSELDTFLTIDRNRFSCRIDPTEQSSARPTGRRRLCGVNVGVADN
jgi:hypothetical protein